MSESVSNRNENRPCYKKTKVGWIPEEWSVAILGDICCQPVSGYSVIGTDRPAKEGEHGVLKLSCIQNGRFEPNENKLVNGHDTIKLKTPVKKDTLLVSRSNTDELVGAVCYVDRNVPSLFLSDLIWEVSARNNSAVSVKWLVYLLCSEQYRAQIVARANGTSGSMKKITKPGFLGIRIPLPPNIEQKKISEILASWDEAIEQMRKLIDAKKHLKKSLMQQLLTGKRRLPGFGGKWKTIRLKNLLQQVSRPVKFDDRAVYDLISIRRRSEGVFHRGKIPGHSILTKQIYIARSGDFLLSKMQIVHGASALVTREFDGMHISGSYIALRVLNPKKLDESFLNWISRTPYFYHLTYLASYGVHIEKMTFNLGLFLKSEINIPERIEEQRCIVEILSAADNEIEALERKLLALEKQKRGLMQKLLTGEVRVKL
jgi:type I restriction enzyme S subunit